MKTQFEYKSTFRILSHGRVGLFVSGVLASLILSNTAYALPQGGQLKDGQATISLPNSTQMNINQASNRAVIDWQSFNIAANEKLNIIQPSSSAMLLSRVVGNDPSKIFGQITANGGLMLINQNGILFGKGSRVDVAALVASTANIKNEDFMAGKMRFMTPSNPNAKIINEGTITVKEGGLAALVAPYVQNNGFIIAKYGTVAIAGANTATIDLYGDNLIVFETPDEIKKTIENSGTIEAGYVAMSVSDAKKVVDSSINMNGIIKAQNMDTSGGKVILTGGNIKVSGTVDASGAQGDGGNVKIIADMKSGTLDFSGKVDVSSKEANGGFVETSGNSVKIADTASVNAKGKKYGEWLIDPNDYTILADGTGDITGAALSNALENASVTISTAIQGHSGNGDIFVYDNITWNANTILTLNAQRDIHIDHDIMATGNTAGVVLYGGYGRNFYLYDGAKIGLSGSNPSLSIGGNEYKVINSTNFSSVDPNSASRFALGTNLNADVSAYGGKLASLGHQVTGLNYATTSTWETIIGRLEGTEATVLATDYINNGILWRQSSGYYWMNYVLPIGVGLSADDTKLEIRLRNGAANGGISAYDTGIQLQNSAGYAVVNVNFQGEQWGLPWTNWGVGDHGYNYNQNLVQDLSNWHTIGIETKNGKIAVYFDDSKILESSYSGSAGKYYKISATGKGSPQIDFVRLYQDGNLIVNDNFNTKTTSVKTFSFTDNASMGTNKPIATKKTIASSSGSNDTGNSSSSSSGGSSGSPITQSPNPISQAFERLARATSNITQEQRDAINKATDLASKFIDNMRTTNLSLKELQKKADNYEKISPVLNALDKDNPIAEQTLRRLNTLKKNMEANEVELKLAQAQVFTEAIAKSMEAVETIEQVNDLIKKLENHNAEISDIANTAKSVVEFVAGSNDVTSGLFEVSNNIAKKMEDIGKQKDVIRENYYSIAANNTEIAKFYSNEVIYNFIGQEKYRVAIENAKTPAEKEVAIDTLKNAYIRSLDDQIVFMTRDIQTFQEQKEKVQNDKVNKTIDVFVSLFGGDKISDVEAGSYDSYINVTETAINVLKNAKQQAEEQANRVAEAIIAGKEIREANTTAVTLIQSIEPLKEDVSWLKNQLEILKGSFEAGKVATK